MTRSLFLILFLLPILGISQQYKLTIDNIHQPVTGLCNQLEFDIYIQNVGTGTLYLSAFMGGIDFNYAGMCNGGTISGAFVPGSSYNPSTNAQLNYPLNNCNWHVNQWSHQIRCLAVIQTSVVLADIIPTSAPGIKLGTLRLTNTVAFTTNSTPNFSWSFVTAANQTKTAVTAWVNGATSPVSLTNQTSFSYVNQGPECFINGNPALSAGLLNAVISSQVYPETCNFNYDGAIDVSISPPGVYSYQWSNGAITEDIANLANGNYTLSIQGGPGGCLSTNVSVPLAGSNCGTIHGKVFTDLNNDCVLNGSDVGTANVHVQLSSGPTTVTNSNGDFVFNAINYGSYGISTIPNAYYAVNSCSQPDSAHLSQSQPLDSLSFKGSSDTNVNMKVIVGGQTLAPGFIRNHYIMVHNMSAYPVASSIFSFVVNSALSLDSATPGYTLYPTASGDSLVWNVGFNPLQWKNFTVRTLVPVSTPVGMTIPCRGHVVPVGQVDFFPYDNDYTRTAVILSSCDPNDKQVNPIGVGPNGIITLSDTMLDYNINFQNTGTAEAINVSIMDTLSNKLDWSSLEVTSFSHPYMIYIPAPGVVQFKFINILLPDSNTNEPLSHGYISYRIRQMNSNVLGDVIQNNAYITFDFNSPVVTNTTTNTLGSLSPLWVHHADEILPEIYPNPVTNELTVAYASQKPLLFELFDITGRKVYSSILPVEKFKEELILPSSLRNGMYQYRFSASEGNIRTGKIELRR